MKKIVIPLFLILFQLTFSQKVIPFKNKGVVFSKEYQYYLFDTLKRFTPNIAEIRELEALLSKNIEEINTSNFKPLIHKNLNTYKRQYIGLLNEKNEKIIYINLLWKGYKSHTRDGKVKEPWKTEWFETSDGGSYYWNIKYHLTRKTFFDFRVNRPG